MDLDFDDRFHMILYTMRSPEKPLLAHCLLLETVKEFWATLESVVVTLRSRLCVPLRQYGRCARYFVSRERSALLVVAATTVQLILCDSVTTIMV